MGAGGAGGAGRAGRAGWAGALRGALCAADWAAAALLLGLVVLAEVAPARRRFLRPADLPAVSFPLQANTVPSWSVPAANLAVPLAVMAAHAALCRPPPGPWRVFRRAVTGLLFATLVNGALTGAVKNMVGRPRPDMLSRCFPAGVPDPVPFAAPGVPACEHDDPEGWKSFPSGHSSWYFCGMGYTSLYLAAFADVLGGRGGLARSPGALTASLAPVSVALLVAVSRVMDYRHNPSDVLAGSLLGLLCAWAFFRQQVGGPLARERARVLRREVAEDWGAGAGAGEEDPLARSQPLGVL